MRAVDAIRKPPVTIGKLEAFVADYARHTVGYPTRARAPHTRRSVAIIGAGPAGLAVPSVSSPTAMSRFAPLPVTCRPTHAWTQS